MFADAHEKVSIFTHPIIVSIKLFDNTVTCTLGAFVILNRKGWALTVAHILKALPIHQKDSKEIEEYKQKVEAIKQDVNLNAKQRRKRIKRLKSNSNWITNHSFWWGKDGVRSKEFIVLPEVDIAAVRLAPFEANSIAGYPTLKNPSNLRIGTSLCRLGYPFHNIEATFQEETQSFQLTPGALPVPRFPIEGIYTRNLIAGKTQDEKYEIKLP